MGLLPHSLYQQCGETVLFESWLPKESFSSAKTERQLALDTNSSGYSSKLSDM